MQIKEFRSREVQPGVARWLVLVAALLALVIAYWIWTVTLRPSSLPPSHNEHRPEALAKQVQGRHFFGAAGSVLGALSAIPDAAQMVLAGIISSGSSKRGVAVILIEGKKAVTARVGQEIVPDVILSRVAHDHVELTRHGQKINLRLASKK